MCSRSNKTGLSRGACCVMEYKTDVAEVPGLPTSQCRLAVVRYPSFTPADSEVK